MTAFLDPTDPLQGPAPGDRTPKPTGPRESWHRRLARASRAAVRGRFLPGLLPEREVQQHAVGGLRGHPGARQRGGADGGEAEELHHRADDERDLEQPERAARAVARTVAEAEV